MKSQPRRFVVEVKRGTSREAFVSHHESQNKFSKAEALLFSKPVQVAGVTGDAVANAPAKVTGRVLPVLSEPEPIYVVEPAPARQRGRPPGSKNKPKPGPLPAPRAEEPVAAVAATVDRAVPEEATPAPVHDDEVSQDLEYHASATTPRRGRLRDRSRILKRYVLKTEPRAGERRWTHRKREV